MVLWDLSEVSNRPVSYLNRKTKLNCLLLVFTIYFENEELLFQKIYIMFLNTFSGG